MQMSLRGFYVVRPAQHFNFKHINMPFILFSSLIQYIYNIYIYIYIYLYIKQEKVQEKTVVRMQKTNKNEFEFDIKN